MCLVSFSEFEYLCPAQHSHPSVSRAVELTVHKLFHNSLVVLVFKLTLFRVEINEDKTPPLLLLSIPVSVGGCGRNRNVSV